MNNGKAVLGVDIGGTNFRMGLVNEAGELVNYKAEGSHVLVTAENHSLENLAARMEAYLAENLDGGILKGIAIGFPSTVSKDKTMVFSTPNLNLNGFENVNIAAYIGNRMNVPVWINKDVHFLLTYDLAKLKLERKGITLGLYIGTGFGNSIYINGEFLDGKNGVAGELGHIPTLNMKLRCGCGNVGCAEVYASGAALQRLKERFFPDTYIGDVFAEHGEDERLKQFVDGLTIPIATEINIFDPDYIVIGGGIPAMKGFPKAYFEQCMKRHVRKPYPAEALQIMYSKNRQEAGVIGAGLYAFQKLSPKG
ncbi:allose kinase [Paenibacillus sp. YN15]|uniref:allose kinase n=1 Tax=Paenibacillus sp. YN15 TaxID=1742774 RepID=UPI000DCF60BE|nr:allose kinase [Paenibacillus sp. YN15]RAV05016.1 allose kinase [Paenibacillus sp. YN15]